MNIKECFATGNIVYLSGPISPNEMYKSQEGNLTVFRLIDNQINDVYDGLVIVLNPATLPQDLDYDEMMKRDYVAMLSATHILMLPGWQHSRGACSELLIANQMNLKVRYLLSDHETVVKALLDCAAVKSIMLDTIESSIGSL